MARLTKDPAEIDTTPGWANQQIRLKYAHISELLAETRDYNASIGRRVCEASDYMEAHLDDDVVEIEKHIFGNPSWGHYVLAEFLRVGPAYSGRDNHPHGDLVARMVQHNCALGLLEHGARARQAVCLMLYHTRMRFVSPQAAYCILAWLCAHHPNPRRFLEKPRIRTKFPADLELHRFPAPDFD